MTNITLTVREIVGGYPAIRAIADKELPAVTAWKLAKILRTVGDEYDAYESARRPLVEKYGEQDEVGNIQVARANIQKFESEVKEVLDQEVVVALELISLDDLGDVPVKATDLAPAWFIFKEEHNERV